MHDDFKTLGKELSKEFVRQTRKTRAKPDDTLPTKIGEKFSARGQVFEYTGKETKIINGNTWECFMFKSKTHILTYPPLKLLNDLCAGIVRRI